MNSLKRQAAKAERYAKLRDEMRAQLRIVLASKFAQMDAEEPELARADCNAVSRRFDRSTAVSDNARSGANRAHAAGLRDRERDARSDAARESIWRWSLNVPLASAQSNEERCAELECASRCGRRPNWSRRSSIWQH